MAGKTTMSIDKDTAELVKKVKRKMSFDIDEDLTTDQTIVKLCEEYLARNESAVDTVEQPAEAKVEED